MFLLLSTYICVKPKNNNKLCHSRICFSALRPWP